MNMDLMPWLFLQGSRSGDTNLKCPACRTRIDTLGFSVIDPDAIQSEQRLICPHCTRNFWPENGLLLTLDEDVDSYFGFPLSLGGGSIRNFTTIRVGTAAEHTVDTVIEQQEVENINLKGAHRKGKEQRFWLNYEPLEDSYRRAVLGNSVEISLAVNDPSTVSITTNLRDNNYTNIKLGDEIEVLYDANTKFRDAFNPEWILLLREAEAAIRRGNYSTVLPLVIAAFDNLIYRQLYLLFRTRGLTKQKSINNIQSFKSRKNLHRDDLAKDGLDFAVGERLSNGRYAKEWKEFQDLIKERNRIVHPTSPSPLSPPDMQDAVGQFNDTIGMMLCVFNLCWK